MQRYIHNLKKLFKKDPKKFLGVGVLIVVFAISISFFNSVSSSTLDNISGHAWESDNWTDTNSDDAQQGSETMTPPGGMGWLSFNCTSDLPNTCGSTNYGVNRDANGNLTGYAWSSNYGWLKFGGLSGFPTSPGTLPENAKVDLNTGLVTGWARFCAGASNSDCNGYIPNLSNGGWDGWVSLRSTSAPTYGVSLSGSEFSGYAWGGNACVTSPGYGCGQNVLGWISFNCANAGGGGCGTSDYKVRYIPLTNPTVTISANPVNVPTGGSTVISWDGVGLINSPIGCTALGGTGSWPGFRPSPSGSFNTGILPTNGTYTYSIHCQGLNGSESNTSDVTVVVGAVTGLDFYAVPAVVFPPSYQTTLHWNAVPTNPPLTNCVADSSPPLNPDEVPNWDGPVSQTSWSQVLTVPYPTTAFKLTCDNQSGNPVTSTIYVNQGEPPESVSLASNGVIENPGGSGNYTTTLSWNTLNVQPNSCVPSSSPNVPSWNFPTPKTDTGSQQDVSVPSSAPAFTTYTLTCTGMYSGDPISVSLELNENSNPTFSKKQPKYVEN